MLIEMHGGDITVDRAVIGFGGWSDAAGTIEATLAELRELIPCDRVATWDLDGYWHAGAQRPMVTVAHGQIQILEWPAIRFLLARPSTSRPFLLGYGPEPGLNWRSFTGELLDLLRRWGCREILLLGSLYDRIFHDEIVISAVIQDAESYNRVRELGCPRIDYTGPGAVHAVIMDRGRASGISCIGLWTHIPFYLETPHELVMARCIEVVGSLLGIDLHPVHLKERWKEREREIDRLVESNQQLRQSIDAMRKRRDQDESETGRKIVRMHDFVKKRQETPPDEGA